MVDVAANQHARTSVARAIATGSAILPVLFGIGSIVGWHLHVPALVQIHPAFAPMQYNTALALVACGVAMLGVVHARGRWPALLAALACSLGLVTVAQYALGVDFGIDRLLFEPHITLRTSQAGRMAPNTAIVIVIAGATLTWATLGRRRARRASRLAIGGALVAGLGATALVGYAGGIDDAYGWGHFTGMALNTAISFALLGCGMVSEAWSAGEPDDADARRWLISVPVVICGAVIVSLLSRALAAEEQDDVVTMVRSYAHSAREQIDFILMDEVRDLREITMRPLPSGARGGRACVADFEQLERERLPGLLAVARVSKAGRVACATSITAERAEALVAAAQRDSESLTIVPAPDDPASLVVVEGPYPSAAHREFLVATFALPGLLRRLPDEPKTYFDLCIVRNATPVHCRGDAGANGIRQWQEISLHPASMRLNLRVSPTPALVATAHSPLPTIALVGGLLSVGLLGFVVFLAQSARLQARALARSHALLEIEIAVRLQAEGGLRFIRDFEGLLANLAFEMVNAEPARIDTHIENALAEVARFVEVDRAAVYVLSEDRRTISNTHEWCAPGVPSVRRLLENLPVETVQGFMDELETQRISRTTVDELPAAKSAEREMLRRFGVHSRIQIPLVTSRGVIGALVFIMTTPRPSRTHAVESVLRITAELFANALERKDSDMRLSFMRDLERLILNLATDLVNADASTIDAHIENGLGAVGRFSEVDRAGIYLFDEDGKTVSNTHEWCAPAIPSVKTALQKVSVEWGRFFADKARTQEVLYTCIDDLPLEMHAERAALQGFGVHSRIQVPLVTSRGVVGALVFVMTTPRPNRTAEFTSTLRIAAELFANALERKRGKLLLLDYQDKLRSLAHEASRAEESERRRIAAGLHDNTIQSLGLSRLKLCELRASSDLDGGLPLLDEALALIERTISETRTLLFDLSPPVLYELGLAAGLRWLVEHTRERYGLACTFIDEGSDAPVETEAAVVVFQAVRELLLNVHKHASASDATVRLQRSVSLTRVSVEDNGHGFDCNEGGRGQRDGGFGLFSIRERVERLSGTVEVDSSRGRGTTVALTLPAGAREEVRA